MSDLEIQTASSPTDELIVGGNVNLSTSGVITIASGQTLSRGSVLGQITDTGKYVLATSASNDGSQTPKAILAQDVDASAGDIIDGLVYLSGQFNQSRLTFGSGFTAANAYGLLKRSKIYLVSVMA